jgi:hypothetical protein
MHFGLSETGSSVTDYGASCGAADFAVRQMVARDTASTGESDIGRWTAQRAASAKTNQERAD